MTDDTAVRDLLRRTLPPVSVSDPARDLWPLIVDHRQPWPSIRWIDLSLAIAAAIALLAMPHGWLLFTYHF